MGLDEKLGDIIPLDLVFTDAKLPDGNGMEVLRHVFEPHEVAGRLAGRRVHTTPTHTLSLT